MFPQFGVANLKFTSEINNKKIDPKSIILYANSVLEKTMENQYRAIIGDSGYVNNLTNLSKQLCKKLKDQIVSTHVTEVHSVNLENNFQNLVHSIDRNEEYAVTYCSTEIDKSISLFNSILDGPSESSINFDQSKSSFIIPTITISSPPKSGLSLPKSSQPLFSSPLESPQFSSSLLSSQPLLSSSSQPSSSQPSSSQPSSSQPSSSQPSSSQPSSSQPSSSQLLPPIKTIQWCDFESLPLFLQPQPSLTSESKNQDQPQSQHQPQPQPSLISESKNQPRPPSSKSQPKPESPPKELPKSVPKESNNNKKSSINKKTKDKTQEIANIVLGTISSASPLSIMKQCIAIKKRNANVEKCNNFFEVYKNFETTMKAKKNNILHFIFKNLEEKYVKDSRDLRILLKQVDWSLINEKNGKGETPVHQLMKSGSKSIVQICLLEINLMNIYDYSIVDNSNQTVFDRSVERGDLDIIKLVLFGGGELGMKNKRSKKFLTNFKNYKNLIYRAMEIKQTFNNFELKRFIPTFLLLEWSEGFIMSRLEEYFQYFETSKGNQEEIENWNKLVKRDQPLGWEILEKKAPISFQSDVKVLATETICKHISRVTNINPARGYIDFEHTIGSGGNAMVFEGCLNSNFAAFKLMSFNTKHHFEDFFKEISAVGQVSEKEGNTVVKTYGVLLNDSHSSNGYLVMEMAESTLQAKLSNPTEIVKMFKKGIWKSIFKIINDLLESMKSIFDVELVHRDIKTANFLIQTDGKIVMSDFGTGRDVSSKPDNTKGTLLKPVGTAGYMDPLLGTQNYAFEHYSDIFSFGVVLWELIVVAMTGVYQRPITSLYKYDYYIKDVRSKGFQLKYPDETPSSFKSLIDRMCSYNHQARPSIEQVCKDISMMELEFNNSITHPCTNNVWKEFKTRTISKISEKGEVTSLTYESIFNNRLAINRGFKAEYIKPFTSLKKEHIKKTLSQLIARMKSDVDAVELCDYFINIMFILKEIDPYYRVYIGKENIYLFEKPQQQQQ
ncbi:hypothetical protein ACTFIV_005312 [Dictyostelium citrinum]